MAIIIPSKSIYTPIENEKVRAPINSVSISEFYTNPQNITFLKKITTSGSSGNEEDVLMPISDYFPSTLKLIGELSFRVDYHIGNEDDEKYEAFYNKYNFNLKFNNKMEWGFGFERDKTAYYAHVDFKIISNENGISYWVYFYSSATNVITTDGSESDYKDVPIYIDSVQLSFVVSAVKRDLQEQTVKFGNDSKEGFSVSSNELLQSSATVNKGFSGIRFCAIEAFGYIDEDINEGKRYSYRVLQGNELDQLSPTSQNQYRYLGVYYDYTTDTTVVNIYNLPQNTEINEYNLPFIKSINIYFGVDGELVASTYSWGSNLLSVFVKGNIDVSYGLKVVFDFGLYGWVTKEKLSSFIAKNVLTQYINGKETAKIKCSVNEFYDENDELAISPNGQNFLPMLFSINDEVIPMVTEDRAISYKDGKPKVFRVVSTRFENRGALWQELTLQEK
jgi:hypothetical protein